MKIHIRRQGIVIRSVEVKGDKASIGSGPECEVRVDDPYLGAHVADIVNHGGEWRIIDKATSLEGVTHDGRRIEDEPLVPGQSYAVGAFEIIAERPGGPPAAAHPQRASEPAVPQTVVQSFDELRGGGDAAIPKTLFETPLPQGVQGATPPPQQAQPYVQPQPAPSGFQPMASAPPQRPAPPAAPAGTPAKRRSKLPLLIALFGLMFVVVLIALLMMMGGGGEEAAQTATTPAATPAPTPVQAGVSPAERGNQLAAELEIDQALQSWETAIQAGGNDPLRARYAAVAYDAAMVHAAANDSQKSRSYLERVVKFGPPESPEVADAKARLGS